MKRILLQFVVFIMLVMAACDTTPQSGVTTLGSAKSQVTATATNAIHNMVPFGCSIGKHPELAVFTDARSGRARSPIIIVHASTCLIPRESRWSIDLVGTIKMVKGDTSGVIDPRNPKVSWEVKDVIATYYITVTFAPDGDGNWEPVNSSVN